jgi:hypothetical protein
VLDLRRIAASPGFSWEQVGGRLREWGGLGAARMAFAHLRRLVPELETEEARRVLPPSPWREAALLPLRSTHPLDRYRGTRRRLVQLWLAAAALERPLDLPGYARHRAVRDRRPGGPSL